MILKLKQQGAGLLEVLVAVIILSVGLLGIAGMEAASLRNNVSSMNRSNATFLLGSIMDKIRANPGATASYTTSEGAGLSVKYDNCRTISATCGTGDIAAADIAEWKCLLGNFSDDTNCDGITALMADGDGEIEISGNMLQIRVMWSDGAGFDAASGKREANEKLTLQATMRRLDI